MKMLVYCVFVQYGRCEKIISHVSLTISSPTGSVEKKFM